MVSEESGTIDWLNHFTALPLEHPMRVRSGDLLQVSFQYRSGGSIPSLQAAIGAGLLATVAVEAAIPVANFA